MGHPAPSDGNLMFIRDTCTFRWVFNVYWDTLNVDGILMFIGTPCTFRWNFNVYWDTLNVDEILIFIGTPFTFRWDWTKPWKNLVRYEAHIWAAISALDKFRRSAKLEKSLNPFFFLNSLHSEFSKSIIYEFSISLIKNV